MKHFYFLCGFLLIFFGSSAQQTPEVDFTHLEAEIGIKPSEGKVIGKILYTFDVLQETDSIFIDAQDMEFQDVELNGEEVDFLNDGNRLWIVSGFQKSLDNKLGFAYSATPDQSMYFIGWDNAGSHSSEEKYDPQVWTQGQGKYTSHWLPSFDDANEKVEFDLSFDFKKDFELISNGTLEQVSPLNDSINRWEFDMEHHMSSYLVAMVAGKYDRKQITSSSGVPIYLYYHPKNEEYVEPTYRHTKKIFDFLEEEIGVGYPWKNYKQVPVRDFLYAGMENTGTTVFSSLFITDSIGFKDRNYVTVNAHELAHQWFGDYVTAKSGGHHWLQEGFATYYALLAEREIFGDDYFYWKLFETAEQLKERSDKGGGESLRDPNAGSLTVYQKGALALHILKEKVGKDAFDEGIKNYLKAHSYGNASTSDFMGAMEKASGMDLSLFVAQWLKQSAFMATDALNSLKKSKFIQDYLQIAALKELPLENKRELLHGALDFPVNEYIGQEVVYQLALADTSKVIDLYKKAFATNNIFVRQAIAASMNQIPDLLKSEYESLLGDESYLTKELALYNLWMNFPEDRSRYLDKMKGIDGFSDKNIRILWLALNLATPDYHPAKKQEIYNELSGYVSPYYPYYIRQNALRYLFQLNALSDESLKNLLQGVQHPVSRFRTFSREMARELLKQEEYRMRFKEIKKELPSEQQTFLEQELAPSSTSTPE